MTASMNLFAHVHAAHIDARVVSQPRLATHAVLTPTALDRLLGEAQRSAVRVGDLTVIVAGDRLSLRLHDRARSVGLEVHHYYGAAELSFVAWGHHAEDLRPFPGVELDLRDDEIWVRSPYLCSGYADGAGGAGRVGGAGPLRRDERGFATVGDRGRLHRDAGHGDGAGDRLEVDGRPASVTTGGATVQVAEVESTLRGEAHGEVVVLGVPHTTLGHVIAAVLTDAGDRDTLVALARDRLSAAARPRAWYHVPQPPLTPAGKLDRSGLAARVTGDAPPRRLT